MIEWPDTLIEAIARRRAVIFIGAGVSMNSKNDKGKSPPSWKGFLDTAINKCDGSQRELRKILKSGDYLSCCQIIKQKLDHDWVNLLEDIFLKPKYKHAKIHEQILRLDSSIIITPNYDKIFDNYASAATGNLLKIKKFYDGDIPRVLRGGPEQRLILKMHGCIDTPDKLIFSRQEYADARSSYSNFYRAIDALIYTHAFLFVGCGLSDPDLSLMLEQYARSFGAAPPNYFVTSEKRSTEYEEMISRNYNLKLLRYSSANDHVDLLNSISALNEGVETRWQQLGESTLW
jgi:hypothetical protein